MSPTPINATAHRCPSLWEKRSLLPLNVREAAERPTRTNKDRVRDLALHLYTDMNKEKRSSHLCL
jgi:hypothetical protein